MRKWISGLLIFLFLSLTLFSIVLGKKIKEIELKHPTPTVTQVSPTISPEQTTTKPPLRADVATNLSVPWALAFLPNKDILFTERPGRVRLIESKGELHGEPIAILRQQPVATISDVFANGEGGLLGIAADPSFANNHFVYVYYSYRGTKGAMENKLVRYVFDGNSLAGPKTILEGIPGNSNHDGGRIKFGPDGFLYITTGDSQDPSLAQNKSSLAGKILRVTPDGDPAPGNPFDSAQGKSAFVYSYGHRNPQGLAWDSQGRLWSTEHGRSTPTGFDELNLIDPGKNYGWPTIQGDEKKAGMVTPVINSGPTTTWAPAGAAFYQESVFFGGLRGEGLYEAVINGNTATLKKHFDHELGRIRDVVLGPDGFLYITTSNTDGRGTSKDNDDKIIRVDPSQL